MSSEWPQFEKQPLGDGRSWDARFDSYDQYHDDCYYYVRLYEGEVWVADFMVKVGVEFCGDSHWSRPELYNELRKRLAEWAADGKTNTAYQGKLWRP